MKKLVAIIAAAALVLALPTMAFAAPSPTNNDTITPVNGDNGTSASASGPGIADNGNGGYLIIEPSEVPDDNADAAAANGSDVLASYSIYMSDDSDLPGETTLVFNVGSDRAGQYIDVYKDGTLLGTYLVASDGTISVKTTACGIFTIAVSANGGSGTNKDNGSTSPSTGATGLVTVAALAAVAGVVVIARRKINE